MSKQNRANPKYILLSTPSLSNTQTFKPIKLGSLHNKTMLSTQKSLFKKYQSPQPIVKKQTFKSLSKQVTADITSVRSLLSECMNNMVIQEKRNLTLKNLISILELQMKKMEENEKQLHKIQDQQNLKKAQKVQYDIEQILQKYNEEIAKINCLKEQTFSARSDRVVFSNLFKKIEKQIKHNVDQYKQLILRTQMNREKKALKQQAQQYQLSKQESIDQVEQRDDNTQHQFNKMQMRQIMSPQDSKFFVTSLNHKGGMNSNQVLKKVSHRIGLTGDNGSSSRLKVMIEELQTKIQKISKIAECDSCEEAMKIYSKIEAEGEQLLSLISEEDQKIEKTQSQIDRIKLQKRISQIYQEKHLQKLESIPSMRKIRSMKSLKTTLTEQSQRNDENFQIFTEMIELFSPSTDKNMVLTQQTLEPIQHHIESLFTAKTFKKSDSNISLTNSASHDLDNILNKMDKFDNCDRILNRKQFCNEYTKEMNKSKKNIKGKK